MKRRADVVGVFPKEASITRLIGSALLEQNDEWLLQCRYMQVKGMAELKSRLIDADPAKLPPMAARPMATSNSAPIYTSLTDTTRHCDRCGLARTGHSGITQPGGRGRLQDSFARSA